jgi:hypothetical protein
MVLVIMASMDASLPLDPLIAEAKYRMRRRRTMAVALVLLAGATALTLALRPRGSAPAERVTIPRDSNSALARLKVPLDAGEKHWRTLLPPLEGAAASRSAVLAARDKVMRVVNATGATLVRLKIWPRTSPPAVELVVATPTDSAIFVRQRFRHLFDLVGPDYVRVVDAHGAMTFVWGGAGNEGFVGSAPALAGCIWGLHGDATVRTPACPVK